MNKQHNIIIDIQDLSRCFGDKTALDQVSLQVCTGQVLGIVGENGAGKTTLIKHILGLYKAQQGSVSVFGHNPVSHPELVLSRIGYLSEQPDFPDWMTVAQFIRYTAAFYNRWDKQYSQELISMFAIDTNKKIRDLSKGQKARVGLCVAQAHRPELLLLDEPSSGLDPVIRKDILSAIIRTVTEEGRTVILSSHFLEEIERVCDHLVMFSQSKVLISDSMDNVLNMHHQFSVHLNSELKLDSIPEIFKQEKNLGEWQLYCYGELDLLISKLNKMGAKISNQRAMTLNEIFMARSPDNKALSEAA